MCFHGGKADRILAKPVVGVCVAGGGGGGAGKCAASLESILQTGGFNVVDMVPVRRQNLWAKLEMLSAVCKWLATMPGSA